MHVVRAAIPFLRKQGGGRIIQISSEGGQTTYPGFSAYHASKWGIEGFIESRPGDRAVWDRLHAHRIWADRNQLRPALEHATAIKAYEATPIGKLRRGFESGKSFTQRGDPEDVARAIVAAAEAEPAALRSAPLSGTTHSNATPDTCFFKAADL